MTRSVVVVMPSMAATVGAAMSGGRLSQSGLGCWFRGVMRLRIILTGASGRVGMVFYWFR